MIQKLLQYIRDVRSELLKVSWPTRNELVGATVLVLGLSLAISAYVFFCDKVLELLVRLLLGVFV